jgi:hypothetical protein
MTWRRIPKELHLQDLPKRGSCISWTLKKEAARSPKMSINILQSTQLHTLECMNFREDR